MVDDEAVTLEILDTAGQGASISQLHQNWLLRGSMLRRQRKATQLMRKEYAR